MRNADTNYKSLETFIIALAITSQGLSDLLIVKVKVTDNTDLTLVNITKCLYVESRSATSVYKKNSYRYPDIYGIQPLQKY